MNYEKAKAGTGHVLGRAMASAWLAEGRMWDNEVRKRGRSSTTQFQIMFWDLNFFLNVVRYSIFREL